MTPGAPGLDSKTWDYAYDVRPTIMTLSVTSATGEVSRSRSYYRAEQYDSDLGLYYLRARYYNPLTGRFLSRDPEDGDPTDPQSLHRYLYANGDPINGVDPMGREDQTEWTILIKKAIKTTAAVVKCSGALAGAYFVLADALRSPTQISRAKATVAAFLAAFFCVWDIGTAAIGG